MSRLTPTPWHVEWHTDAPEPFYCLHGPNGESVAANHANDELIVSAVNLHDRLVEALKRLLALSLAMQKPNWPTNAIRNAQELLFDLDKEGA